MLHRRLRLGKISYRYRREALILALAGLLIVPFNQGITNRLNLIVFGIIALAIFLLVVFDQPAKLPRQNQALVLSAIALAAWIFTSTFWSPDKTSALNAAYIYGEAALIFIVLLGVFKHGALKRIWVWTYLIVAALCSLIGIWSLSANPSGRIQLGWILANSAAGWLLPAVVLLIFGRSQFRAKTAAQKLFLLLISGCVVAGFILSFSRGAWACLVLTSVVLIFLRNGWKFAAAAVAFLLIIVPAAARVSQWTSVKNSHSSIVQNIFRSSNITVHDRKIYAQSALDLFRRHPLTGSGAGSYRIAGTVNQPGAVMVSTNAHASLLQFLAEFGLIGTGLLALVGGQILYRFWYLGHNRVEQVYVVAALALMLHFAIDIDLIYPSLVFLLASITALALAPIETDHHKSRSLSRS